MQTNTFTKRHSYRIINRASVLHINKSVLIWWHNRAPCPSLKWSPFIVFTLAFSLWNITANKIEGRLRLCLCQTDWISQMKKFTSAYSKNLERFINKESLGWFVSCYPTCPCMQKHKSTYNLKASYLPVETNLNLVVMNPLTEFSCWSQQNTICFDQTPLF